MDCELRDLAGSAEKDPETEKGAQVLVFGILHYGIAFESFRRRIVISVPNRPLLKITSPFRCSYFSWTDKSKRKIRKIARFWAFVLIFFSESRARLKIADFYFFLQRHSSNWISKQFFLYGFAKILRSEFAKIPWRFLPLQKICKWFSEQAIERYRVLTDSDFIFCGVRFFRHRKHINQEN